MQISGHQPGFNFFSAFKLGAAPTRAQAGDEALAGESASTSKEAKTEEISEKPGDLHRDALLLHSAHRTAGRTADLIEALPEL